jgi:hypothetical protein
MNQYDAVVSKAIPALARDPGQVESDPSWSQEQAEAAFFRRLTMEEELDTVAKASRRGRPERPEQSFPSQLLKQTWRNVSTLCAAGVLLCIALGVSAYRVGIRRGTESASVAPLRVLGIPTAASSLATFQKILIQMKGGFRRPDESV